MTGHYMGSIHKQNKGVSTMLTRDDVELAVTRTIAGFTRLPRDQVTSNLELRDPPLSLDSNQLAFIAMSLRGYVQYYSDGKETVLASEVRKNGLTVKALVDLIFKKVNNNE
jgi:hypothetical protein